jgi:hypothetical protein
VSDVIVCRLKYRVPAAAPEPLCRRQRAYRGFRSLCRRFMRARLDAARIPIRRERGGRNLSGLSAIYSGAVFPAGADGQRRGHWNVVRRYFHRLLNVFQDAQRDVSNHLKTPFAFAVNHDEQASEGNRACLTRGGANPHPNGASR